MDLPSKCVLSCQQQQKYAKELKFIVGRKKGPVVSRTALHSRKNSQSDAMLDRSDSRVKFELRTANIHSITSFQSAFATRDRYWEDDAKAMPEETSPQRHQDLPNRIMRLSQSLTRISGLKNLAKNKTACREQATQVTSESTNFTPETADTSIGNNPSFFKYRLQAFDSISKSPSRDKLHLHCKPQMQNLTPHNRFRNCKPVFEQDSITKNPDKHKSTIEHPCIRLKFIKKTKSKLCGTRLGLDTLKENIRENQHQQTRESLPAEPQQQHKIMSSLEGMPQLSR